MTTACSDNYGYTGNYYGVKTSKLGVPVMMIFTTDSYELTESNFALHAQQMAKVKELKAFPVPLKNLEKNHEDPNVVTHPDRSRELTQQEKRRYSLSINANSCLGKQLMEFRGFSGGVIFVYNPGGNAILEGYKLETDKIKGIPMDYVNVKGLDAPNADGSDTAMVTIEFDLTDEADMTINGFFAELDKSWTKVDGLTPVTLIQVGTASATSIVVDVYSTCATGCNKPIPAMVTADFAVSGAGSISNVAESSTVAGRYTITGTLFDSTTVISLVAPSALSLIYNPVVATVPAVIAVT